MKIKIVLLTIVILSSCFCARAQSQATGTVTLNNNNLQNIVIVIGGVNYKFRAVLTPPYEVNEVLVGANVDASAQNLSDAINGSGSGGEYGGPSIPSAYVTSAITGAELSLTAIPEGSAGNSITLSTDGGSTVTLSGSRLSGGSDLGSGGSGGSGGTLPGETVPASQAQLDSYFTTGATPTPFAYAELIDTMFYYVNAIFTNSYNSSSQASNAAVATAASFLLCYSNNNSDVPKQVFYLRSVNISSNTWSSGGGNVIVTNWFTQPMADNYYSVNVAYNSGFGISFISNTPNYCVINFLAGGTLYSANHNYYGPIVPGNSNLCYVVIYR